MAPGTHTKNELNLVEPPTDRVAAPVTKPDAGLTCLVMMARLHGVAADPDQLAHEFAVDGEPFRTADILLAARKLGLRAKAVKTDVTRLGRTPLPAMRSEKRLRVRPSFSSWPGSTPIKR